jgi:hypothetical protein
VKLACEFATVSLQANCSGTALLNRRVEPRLSRPERMQDAGGGNVTVSSFARLSKLASWPGGRLPPEGRATAAPLDCS